ncbi:AbrB/MazE/SpoVT family DNA-binding domain-containing protein [Desulfallas sp. Bu1-1]|uniref:AbrB/MazE/SpoVT family DNA-binding domain-containing protein n=1 Tax=Desulfallas sp. Bu1-1 TaxID=2787620 RepID=UPI00189DADF7|nr:AbrB/MazE/SpoVT family DNA-binding domain-containing protein [Desulfallas sp. Bu1-1]MBF7082122.1 AbrB/MazE/SpoVT family DNA-binding domain-containing protein [Desulfallas sp. Bu1-1]
MTSKGQVTIPVIVRRKLNLQPGDELLFDLGPEGEVKVRALKRKRLTELYASLPAKRPYPGKAEVREGVAAGLARQILGKGKET